MAKRKHLTDQGVHEVDAKDLADLADVICCICLDDLNAETPESVVGLPCGHMFHRRCVTKWLTKKSTTCPLCKHELRTRSESEP